MTGLVHNTTLSTQTVLCDRLRFFFQTDKNILIFILRELGMRGGGRLRKSCFFLNTSAGYLTDRHKKSLPVTFVSQLSEPNTKISTLH